MKANFTSRDQKKASGVYSIICLSTGRRYVGSTKGFRGRYSNHKKDLKDGVHDNKRLQSSWDSLGADNFEFVILEEVSNKSKLLEREQYWMDYYQVSNPEYGFNVGEFAACGHLGRTHNSETRARMSRLAKARGISSEQRAKMVAGIRHKPRPSKKGTNPKYKVEFPVTNGPNTYFLISPKGKRYVTKSLHYFCNQNCLHQSHLSKALRGEGFYKGWAGKIRPTKEVTEQDINQFLEVEIV